MPEVEINDGVIQVDASIVGEHLGLEPYEVQRLMREGNSQAAANVVSMKMKGAIA